MGEKLGLGNIFGREKDSRDRGSQAEGDRQEYSDTIIDEREIDDREDREEFMSDDLDYKTPDSHHDTDDSHRMRGSEELDEQMQPTPSAESDGSEIPDDPYSIPNDEGIERSKDF